MANATVTKAEAYFESRLKADKWYTASERDKTKALEQARRALEPYRDRANSTRFFYAVCEQALWLLEGDTRSEMQRAGVKGYTLGSLSEQFEAGGRDLTIAPEAWAYLRSSTGIKLGRIT